MAEYIPTTEDIRTDWMAARHNGGGIPWDDAEAEFDAWLAEHDREVQARALEEAAERAWMNRYSGASHALRKYAARLRTPDAGAGGGS